MAMGAAGWIGLAKENSYGTPVGANAYLEILSEGISHSIDRFEIKNIAGLYTEPDDMAGVNHIAGNIEGSCFPVPTGHILRSIFGAPSSVGVVLSGFLHNNHFTTPTADYTSGEPTPPYTLEIYRDVTSSQQVSGIVGKSVEFSISPNNPLKYNLSVIGKSILNIAKTSPSFVSSSVQPFSFETCSIGIGGAGTALVESLSIEIDNQLDAIPVLNATNVVGKVRRTGPQTVKVKGTLDFTNITEYNNFINQTEQALTVNVTRASSFAMSISVPRMVYTAFPLGMSGKGRETVSFEGKALYHTGSLHAIRFILTNTNSNY